MGFSLNPRKLTLSTWSSRADNKWKFQIFLQKCQKFTFLWPYLDIMKMYSNEYKQA